MNNRFNQRLFVGGTGAAKPSFVPASMATSPRKSHRRNVAQDLGYLSDSAGFADSTTI